MSLLKTFLLLVFLSPTTFAQFTSASLFPEMKAINPAVIGQRSIGMFSAGAARENYEKTQDLSSNFGAGAEGKSDIEITETRFFYGGKKGGFTTSEVLAIIGSGEKKDTVSRPGSSESANQDVNNQYINVGLGLGKHFGISFSRLTFETDQSFNFNFGGSSFSDTTKFEVEGLILRGGALINMGIDIGLYYEHAMADFTTTSDGSITESSNTFPKVGLGLGFNGKSMRLEVGYEKDTKETTEQDGTTYAPDKLYLAWEG